MRLEVSLLGPPRIARDGEPVSFDTRKATALLAYLALVERPRSRASLVELLWPDRDPEHGRGALRRTLSTLRKGIGDGWIEAAGDAVALGRGPGLELDVDRFRALASDGADGDELEAATRVFAGELLEGFSLRDSPGFDDWHVVEGDALNRELGSVLDRLIDLFTARGDHTKAITHARRRLDLDALHEPAHRQLIRLYASTGDRARALGQYRECVRTLSRELGVAPLAETIALYEQVNEGALRPAAPPAGDAPEDALPAGPMELPLVGRAAELAALTDAHGAIEGDGRLAVIEGEAGIGKTALADELIETLRTEGATVLRARCHADEAGLAYGPVADLLRTALEAAPNMPEQLDDVSPRRLADAGLLVPELAELRPETPQPLPLEGPGATARLLEGVAAVLASACRGDAPGVVFLDDLHAADEASLGVVAYLARRLSGRPLLLLCSWRAEEVPPGHRLRRLAGELRQAGTATSVRLGRLDEAAVAELVEAASGSVDMDLSRRVYEESEGLPLFVTEYLAVLRASAGAESWASASGSPARELLRARLDPLGEAPRQVLGAAAVIGRSFDFEGVRTTSGRSDEETVAALEELAATGLVRELAGPGAVYDFSHEKLRALVYEETSLARRRILHGRVADAIALRARQGPEAAVAARHLQLAGRDAESAEHHRLAAEHAASLHAHADGLAHLEAALALDHEEPAELQERIGELRTLLGDYAGALAAYELAAAGRDGAALATVEHKLGAVHQRRGEWERAEARFRAALEAAPTSAPALRSRIEADRSLTAHLAGDSAGATLMAEAARALGEQAGDAAAQAQAHNMLGVLARSAGRTEQARAELERSLALAEELGDAQPRVAALNNLALVHRDAGDLDEALALTERGLELCAAAGDRHREAALHNNLADLHHAAGRQEDSMAHLKRAVAIFSEVGADDATRLPEIWKLTSW